LKIARASHGISGLEPTMAAVFEEISKWWQEK
jgi:hypothetical protein